MMRAHDLHWIFPALLGLAAVACSGKTTQTSAPQQGSDGGIDAGTSVPDAASGEPHDASGGSDSDGASPPAAEAGTDASSDTGGDGADASDAGEGADSAEASIPIDCGESNTCPSAIHLPTIYGGASGAGLEARTHTFGDHSGWYVVEVDQHAGITNNAINLVVGLTPPPNMEFDLIAYLTEPTNSPTDCSQVSGSTNGGQILLSWPINNGTQSTRLLTVHVIAKPGSQCQTGATWRLDVIAS